MPGNLSHRSQSDGVTLIREQENHIMRVYSVLESDYQANGSSLASQIELVEIQVCRIADESVYAKR